MATLVKLLQKLLRDPARECIIIDNFLQDMFGSSKILAKNTPLLQNILQELYSVG